MLGARRGHGRERRPRLVVLEDRQPGRPRRLPDRPRRAEIGELAKRAPTETYISPNMLAESIVYELCRSGGLDRNIELVNAALAERRDAVVERAREPDPRGRVRRPRRRLLPLARPGRGHRHARAGSRSPRRRASAFVAGPDFMLEGGERSLRLSFASVPPGDVPEGIGRIARALGRAARLSRRPGRYPNENLRFTVY